VDGMDGWELIPQIPAPSETPSLTYPSTPQLGPHEFLRRKYSTPFSTP